ncbi:MAG: hypothetical protein RJB08_784 [Actinomycetota bacterium]|jgi:sortase A
MKERFRNRVDDALGLIGKTFITAGLLLLGLVAYQLWGTGIETRRAQDRLHAEFTQLVNQKVAEASTPATTPTSLPATITPPVTAPNRPNKAVALLEVPTAGIADIIVEGVSASALRHGPGHVPRTALPGQPGNSAIAGHRTTYGAPFADLDKVDVGDSAVVTTLTGKFVFEVIDTKIIKPNQTEVLQPLKNKTLLTLITCNPRYSTSQRLVVIAELRKTLPLGTTETKVAPTTSVDETTTTTVMPETPAETTGQVIDVERIDGWFSDHAAILPAILLGLVLISIAFGTKLLRKLFLSRNHGVLKSRVVAYAIVVLPFTITLFFWYRYINLLLPAST